MKALISWFANNHVAANLCMALVMISGLMVLPFIEREVVPQINFDLIEIRVGMPGAGPAQIERTISRKIEQSLAGIEGILDVNTIAAKHFSTTTIEVSNKVSLNEVINEVRTRVDAIGFPKEATRPVVREVIIIEPVLNLSLNGDLDIESLNNIAESIVGELRTLSGVSLAYVRNAPKREFKVEVSETALSRYQVEFSEIARVLRGVSAEIAGASLVTGEGEVSVVGDSSVNNAASLENVAVRSFGDGSRIIVSDLADVQDNNRVDTSYRKFNGNNVVYIGINRSKDEDLLKLADQVSAYIAAKQKTLPDGVKLVAVGDASKQVSGRIDMLKSNAITGFILVFLVLLIFMNARLSFWSSIGIPFSFLGAIFMLFYWGASLNMVSLFAFLLVLGIVVDDAIIIGESIYSQHEKKRFGVQASIDGTMEVYRPVIFAILTTMISFAPLLFMPGEEGRLIAIVPMVVICVLAFSLMESLLVLPSHLSGIKDQKNELFPIINRAQKRFSSFLDEFISDVYTPYLEKALYWRYAVAMGFFVVFFLSISLLGFRWVNVNLVSKIEGDVLVARLVMITDTPTDETVEALKRLEQAAVDVRKEINNELGFEQITNVASTLDNFVAGRVIIYLDPVAERQISSELIEGRLLKNFGEVPHVRAVTTRTSIVGEGPQIDIELADVNLEHLQSASQELMQILRQYKGVQASWDDFHEGKKEVGFELKPEAADMGISSAQVAAQIHQYFHGESLTIYDEYGNLVPVNVAFPDEEKNSIWFLENLPIALKDGSHVPLFMVASLDYRESPSEITIHNGKRSIRVKAKLDEKVSAQQIMVALRKDFFSGFSGRYPGMSWEKSGGQKRSQEVLSYLWIAYPLSLLAMYVLMATLFASYSQPLMIMIAIPFGIVGALIGHLVMGVGVTLWSLVGIIAVSGVVVNDNLVLVDRINQQRLNGISLLEAIRDAGVARFRPIALTSLTTFLGLFPLMQESSVQAQFLIPMAVSLAYGVMFATVISLILVPVFYAMLDDMQKIIESKQLISRSEAYIRKLLKSEVAE